MKQNPERQPHAQAATPKAAAFWKKKLRRSVLTCLLLTVAVLIVYWPVGRHDFVNYDDGDYVTGNAQVQRGITGAGIAWAFTSGHASNWHPITWLSHMLDCEFFGQSAGAHHLVNLTFHLANTLLVFLVLRRMTHEHWRCALVAAIFGLHPLHVESVAWISERKDVLSTFFLLLTLGAYTLYVQARTANGREAQRPDAPQNPPDTSQVSRKSIRAGQAGQRRSQKQPSQFVPSLLKPGPVAYYVLTLAFFFLGLMSKPMLVTVPFLLLLLDYWPFNRALSGDSKGLGPSPSWSKLVLEKTPLFALAAASSFVTFLVQQEGGAVSASLTLYQRLGNAVVAYVRYLYKTFWPADLSVLYPHPGTWPAWMVVCATLLLLGIFAFVIWQARKRSYLAVGWLWFFGMLIPVIGIIQVGIQSMADRYTYVPLIGLSIALVWGLAELVPNGNNRGRSLATCALLALLGCSLLAARQVEFWRDSESLFRRAVEVTSRNYLAYNNLGYYLSNRGRPLEAMEHYRKSLEINPAYEDALNNMGFVLAGQRRHAEAVPYYEAALRVKPKHVEVHNNLGNALSELGRIPEAIEHYRITLEQKPDHADAHNNLGIALAMQGKLEEAILHFRDALRYKPSYASAHSNLGNALAAQQKWDDAIAEYREGLRLHPDDPQAHNNLANVLSLKGNIAEAVEHYNTALRLNANNPEAHFNLGMALLQQGKTPEARGHFTEALRLKPDYAQAQRQLSTLPSTAPK